MTESQAYLQKLEICGQGTKLQCYQLSTALLVKWRLMINKVSTFLIISFYIGFILDSKQQRIGIFTNLKFCSLLPFFKEEFKQLDSDLFTILVNGEGSFS